MSKDKLEGKRQAPQEEQQSLESHPLEALIGKQIKIIANDGRVFVGTLKGLDQVMNCILTQAEQRIYSEEVCVKVQPIGTYFTRGDSIVAIGELIQSEQERQELGDVRATPLLSLQ